MIRRGYDSDDSDFATAIAASAHAIHFLEKSSSQAQIRRANTGKQEPFRPQQGGNNLFLLLFMMMSKCIAFSRDEKCTIFLV